MQQPVGAPEINHPTKNKYNGGEFKLKIDVLSRWIENTIKHFYAGGLKVTQAVPKKHIINFLA